MLQLKPYPIYKTTDMEILEQIPAGWDLVRNKKYLRFRNQIVGEQSNDYTLLSLTLKGIIKRDMENPKGKFPAEFNSYQIVEPGDLVVCLFDVDETPRTVGLSAHHGMITGAYDVLTSDDQDIVNYLYLYFLSLDNVKGLRPLYKGLRKVVPKDSFMSMKVPIPPKQEREAIEKYINNVNSKIIDYVKAKITLINRLKEKKQHIIQQAVTGTIDIRTSNPYPKYKESGVKWLGRIPEEWDVRRIKSLTQVKRGASPRPIADMRHFDVNGEYAWVRISDVTDSDKYLEKTTESLSELGKSLSVPLQPGAIFLSIAGSVGKPIITNIKCCIHDGFVYFPNYKGSVDYLYYVLASGAPYKGLGKMGTQLNLNTETVGSIFIGWPSMDIQKSIASYLDLKLQKLNEGINLIRQEIKLIQEYKVVLIANIITGKFDVRDIVNNLPEYIDLAVIDDIEVEQNEVEIMGKDETLSEEED
jgi:type I restriction enzyme S subunit